MPNNLFIALKSAASFRPPPPEGFEGGGAGTVPTGEAWTLTAPYFIGSTEYPHIFVGYSAGLNNEYGDSGGGVTANGSIAVADNQSWLYYLFGSGPGWTLSKWSLTYPGDWSRTTYEGSVGFNFAGSNNNIEMYIDPGQNHLYVLDFLAETIHQYSLSANPLSATFVRSYSIVSPYSGQPLVATDIWTSPRPKYQSFSICMSGTKLILFSRQILRYLSYTLSTPYDISTATPDWYGNIPFLSADGLIGVSGTSGIVGISDKKYKAVQWTGDGQYLYLLGDNTYRILQFYCSDPWNMSSATLLGSYNYISQGAAHDMFLNDSQGSPCLVLAHLNKLTLWGFGSGLSISSLYFIRSWQPKYPNPSTSITINAITFGDAYQWVYILNGSRVIQYEISGGIQSLGISQSTIGAKTGLANGVSLAMKSDGRELYIMTNGGTIWRSTLSSSYLITTAVAPTNITASRPLGRVCDTTGAIENTSDLGGFYISPDGDKIFTCDQPTGSTFDTVTKGMRVYRYNLSTNWDLSSFSINSRSGAGYFSPNDTAPVKFKMSELGLRIISMYKTYNPDTTSIRILTLSNAGNISSAVYNLNNNTNRYGSYYSVNYHYNSNGKLLFGLNSSGSVSKLTVPTVYNVSAGFDITFQPLVRATNKGPGFLRYYTYNTYTRLKPDGMKLYAYRNVGTNPVSTSIVETTLGTAFGFDSRGTDTIYSLGGTDAPGGFYMRSNGLSYWIYRTSNRRVQEFAMSTAWSISTSTLIKTYTAPHSVGSGLHWTPNGQRLFMGTTDRILSLYCPTAWDISSGIYEDGVTFIAGNGVKDFYMDDTGTKMFICFESTVTSQSAIIREYNMTNFDLTTATLVRSYRPSNRLFNMISSISSVSVVDNGQLMLMTYRNLNGFTDPVTDCLIYRLV